MPTLQIPDSSIPYTLRTLTYRRALYRGPYWLALELPTGNVLVCRYGGAPPRRELAGEAAALFRRRVYAAGVLDAGRGGERRAKLCEAVATTEEQTPCPP